ncbi:guanitoxin biosynthesis heme-dependent pre-guanitoxin N-hydroxylase GntA [Rasiella sp. SM2506]|uniref:guanitoxin biosynthesis heme-dependent pre-guanitoxin N-hydroxylase GntA n=1 Tax=Rasiella sp. SM2506 TaxID=3423914 RepID=UPI003D7B347A
MEIHLEKESTTKKLFADFIVKKNHPCIMAQTVFKMEEVTIRDYKNLGSLTAAMNILKDLETYLTNYDFSSNNFETFIATFPDDEITDEKEFEKKLWLQLEGMHSLDSKPWDASVSKDPEDHNFSFSLLGKAFYIVGLHPNSSRKARQSPVPALVFNLHQQFEKLREMGTYKRVRDRIRKRDKKLQGSINPILADFGNSSEALQYSGRNVSEEWKCPFAPAK